MSNFFCSIKITRYIPEEFINHTTETIYDKNLQFYNKIPTENETRVAVDAHQTVYLKLMILTYQTRPCHLYSCPNNTNVTETEYLHFR